MLRPLLAAAISFLLFGCASGSPPSLPQKDVPARFEGAAPANAPIWPATGWWKGFDDPELSALIAAGQANNLDLAAVEARLRQADARAREAGAALLPSIGLNGGLDAFYGQGSHTSAQETDWSLELGASYELDFWGKNRDTLTSAEAARAASEADRATVGLTVTAGIADSYFQLLSLRDRIAVAEDNLKASQQTLALVQRRVNAGYAAPSDLTQERVNMAAQQAAVQALQQQALETRDALAILVGRPPEGFEVRRMTLAKLSSPPIGPGLPADLLTRRPDIFSAEENLKGAHADLALARKAFLPDLSLSAGAGPAYPALNAAATALPVTGLTESIGGSLVEAIFNGGRLEGRVQETRARQDELLAAYRAAVLGAFSDVENALGAVSHFAAQEAALQEEATQSEMALAAARRKYTAGYADFLVVTDAERLLYSARDQLSDIRRARLAADVALFKALGGGWTAPAKPD
ncbi:MAG: efflux transporter outer membrane subunit [Rhizomicrobium sp.]